MEVVTDKESNLPYHKLTQMLGYLVLTVAVALSVFQIWQGITSTISATYFRPIHLCWVLVLIFLHYPLIKNPHSKLYLPGRVFDVALSALVVFAAYRMTVFDYNDIDYLFYGLSD
ncbi:fused permease component [Vibrio ishigakensis]|uniref:Fused permease component n=2 Tax=Vibrio ishigakensis TaxID=1481914 RepID=A0A0B8P8J6_9VIBR|nr:fused permease component [Vibrio ishigakensis]